MRDRTITFDNGSSLPQAANIETFWINNSIKTELTRSALDEILTRPDVVHVELVRHADVEELLDTSRSVSKHPRGTGTVKQLNRRSKTTVPDTTVKRVETWSVKRVGAPLLWQQGIDGSGVLVAVVDSGVNYNHPHLRNQMWHSPKYPHHGYDFEFDDDDPIDNRGHGTSCAGIVAGNGTKGKMTGVAPRATVIAIRVGGTETQFWRGFEFAIEQGAHIISMSMSWKYPSNPDYPGWRRTCEAILAAGIFHANSIGNQGDDLVTFPVPYNIATPGNCPPPRLHHLQTLKGGLSSPISCGATSDADALASYSGRGPAAWEIGKYTDYPYQNGATSGLIKPDICAPGPGTELCNYAYDEKVPSSKPYTSFGGTSAATPHVAGCLALLACACLRSGTSIVPENVQEALETTAVRVSGQTREKENHYGAGRIDVKAAYDYGVARGWWSVGV